ncbi:alpha/beta hydrolase [uncultured Paraglaciecola sp.]|uniref:alpha/beta fold hydrolase n=1 Tax=uncultured Paraglaciecola sp. TaxID=1765024 RepID=UPI0025940F1B|nr:alpha/beta hydrolase [uncultured Paraglaciecola sp.]
MFNFSAAAENLDTPQSYDTLLSNYEYTLSVKTIEIESQGLTLSMSYSYLPAKGDKPVVTLLHGKNFIADYWANTAHYLSQLGYGVLMPDQIGFGKSSKPRNYQYSFAGLASHTKSLLDSLNIKKSIILGHSMGGMLASRFALMYPETVQELILLNPIGLENYLSYVEYKDTNFFYQNELKKTAQGVKSYQQKFYYDGQWNEQYAALTDFIVGQINNADYKDVAWVNAKTYDMIFTQPVVTEFSDFSMHVSLILGTRDRTGPGRNWKKQGIKYQLGRYDKLGKTVMETIPNGTLYEMEGLGHLPHIEDFDRFTKALNKVLKSDD